MRHPTHNIFFNTVYLAALVLILATFGGLAYFLMTNDVSLQPGGAQTFVLLAAAFIGVLAFLTAVFYLLSRLFDRPRYDEDFEPERAEDFSSRR